MILMILKDVPPHLWAQVGALMRPSQTADYEHGATGVFLWTIVDRQCPEIGLKGGGGEHSPPP